jgi:hypothetical protein
MTFEIEKGVPVSPRVRTHKYPFASMEIGDSFYSEGKTTAALLQAARHVRRHKGFEFKARQEGDGARIWRVK